MIQTHKIQNIEIPEYQWIYNHRCRSEFSIDLKELTQDIIDSKEYEIQITTFFFF